MLPAAVGKLDTDLRAVMVFQRQVIGFGPTPLGGDKVGDFPGRPGAADETRSRSFGFLSLGLQCRHDGRLPIAQLPNRIVSAQGQLPKNNFAKNR